MGAKSATQRVVGRLQASIDVLFQSAKLAKRNCIFQMRVAHDGYFLETSIQSMLVDLTKRLQLLSQTIFYFTYILAVQSDYSQ